MHVRAVMVYREGHVGYLVPLRQEHPLVERLHLVQSFVCFDKTRHSTVQVGGGSEDGEIVLGGDGHRIFMEEAAVSLEMDDSAWLQELTVPLQEQWTGQTAVLTLELGIRERQPDLRDLSGAEKGFDELYPGP